MRSLTAWAGATAIGACVARTAVLTATLAVASMVLALVALSAIWARAEGTARQHKGQAAAVVASVGSGVVALVAIASVTG